MSRCDDPSSAAAAYSTTNPGVELTADGNAALVWINRPLEAPALVATDGETAILTPTYYRWTISELNGPIGLGVVADSNAALLGTDITNLLYMSDGRVVVDGAVVKTSMAYGTGDEVVLYIDPAAGKAAFLLNGVAV